MNIYIYIYGKPSQKYFFDKVENPDIDFVRDFTANLRDEGLSGFMRLRNEAEFLEATVLSWINVLDELIIVFNNCQDATEEIARNLAEKYPEKIKIYHYLPQVYPQGSKQNRSLPANSPHSLVHYYNFALSRTTKKWAIKIDGDLIIPNSKLATELRIHYERMRLYTPEDFLPVCGVNLIDNLGKFYVPQNSKYAGYYGDLCMFRVDIDTIFVKSDTLERLDLSKRKIAPLQRLFAYYHMKFVKSDFGTDNYDFINNPDSHYLAMQTDFLANLQLMPLDKFLTKYQIPLPYMTCEELGIYNRRNWQNDARENFLSKVNLARKVHNLAPISAYQLGLNRGCNLPFLRRHWHFLCQRIYQRIRRLARKILRPYWLKIKNLRKNN